MNSENSLETTQAPAGGDSAVSPKQPTKRGRRPKGVEPPVVPEVVIPKVLPPSTPYFNAYMRFLAASAQASKKNNKTAEEPLDPNEKALLELVALRWAAGTPMTVRQAIALAHLGSPATLHKRLVRLRTKGYLQLQNVSGDKRVKQLVAGPTGLNFIEEQGRHLMSARNATKKANPGM